MHFMYYPALPTVERERALQIYASMLCLKNTLAAFNIWLLVSSPITLNHLFSFMHSLRRAALKFAVYNLSSTVIRYQSQKKFMK